MLRFIFRRTLIMIPTVLIISFVSFVLIQLPPGNYATALASQMASNGETLDQTQIAAIEARYGLGEPFLVQYVHWIGGILHGDLGRSFVYNAPVSGLIMDRLPATLLIAVVTLAFTWLLAFVAGLVSATKQYSVPDYALSTVAFIGLATPSFLLALILMYLGSRYFGISVGGLFSAEWAESGWNLGKLLNLLSHLWAPVLVIGLAHTAGLFRIFRANLLDEVPKPYTIAARARGLTERRILLRYPVPIALNPFISTVGWMIPAVITGDILVGKVLALRTTGPLLLEALLAQDPFLAGGIILLVSVLTVIGTLVSDIILAAVDPRVRLRTA
ncbi:ABC transporter permease [Microlunatus soli]|uniref:Peptide/nickel transport system permease protein n=1 Tax=Microlunatus soli TaxID=630515 RepID=A0A1H1QJG2_9ACTN|nr:ABC transporter permease [Microlunatus soli]SDS23564.1 peptide/nickel transport system permease protein [Microlunatus soli]